MLRFSNPNLTALGGRVNMSQTLAALGYVPGGGGGGTVDSVARAAAAAAQTTANTAVGVAGVAQTTATSALSASTTNTNALANLQSPLAPGQLGAYADVSTPSYLTSLWAWVSAGKIDTAAALTTATTANTAAGTAYTYAGTAYTLATTANTNAGAAATAVVPTGSGVLLLPGVTRREWFLNPFRTRRSCKTAVAGCDKIFYFSGTVKYFNQKWIQTDSPDQ